MSDYRKDRAWSDQYIPAIKQIVGPLLMIESSHEIDTQQAADLIVLKARDVTIAARVMRAGYADRYPHEFTVRSKRDSGSKTEIAKMFEGWGDLMFYGHAGRSPGSLDRWMVIDLCAWRHALLRHGYKGSWAGLSSHQSNGDGTHFMAFDVRRFPASMVVASSHEIQRAAA